MPKDGATYGAPRRVAIRFHRRSRRVGHLCLRNSQDLEQQERPSGEDEYIL